MKKFIISIMTFVACFYLPAKAALFETIYTEHDANRALTIVCPIKFQTLNVFYHEQSNYFWVRIINPKGAVSDIPIKRGDYIEIPSCPINGRKAEGKFKYCSFWERWTLDDGWSCMQ